MTRRDSKGLRPIPIRKGKHPGFNGWQQLLRLPNSEYTKEFVIDLFNKHQPEIGFQQNVGVLGGNQTIILDADSNEAINFFETNLPFTPFQVTRGAEDRRHFYYQASPEILNADTKHYDCFDIISRGAHAVAPTSYHHDSGMYYEWINFGDIDYSLPLLTSDKYQLLVDFGEQLKQNKATHIGFGQSGGRNEQTLAYARKLFNDGGEIEKVTALCIDYYRTNFDNSTESKPDTDEQIAATVKSAYNFVHNNPKSVANAASVARGVPENIVDPEPLRPPAIETRPYPVEALGPVIGDAAQVIADTAQIAVEACANTLLATAATAAQTHYVINLPHVQIVPLSLMFMTIVESGERKSTIFAHGIKPLVEADIKLNENYENDFHKFKIENDVYASEKKHILSKSKSKSKSNQLSPQEKVQAIQDMEIPVRPIRNNFIIDNVTAEGLHRYLQESSPSVGLLSDEGGIMIGGHALTEENQLRIMTTVSKLWDGSTLDRHRGGEGSSQLRNRAFSMHLMAQEAVATLLLCNQMVLEQGFINRILVRKPKSKKGTRLYNTKSAASTPEVLTYQRRLKELASRPINYAEDRYGELNREIIRFTECGKKSYQEFHDYIEKDVGHEGVYGSVSGYAIRACEQAARIAGVLFALENDIGTPLLIDAAYFNRGANLAEWYIVEQIKLREQAAVDHGVLLAEMLLDFVPSLPVQADGTRHVIRRDITQRGPNQLRSNDNFKKAINFLIDRGHLKQNEKSTELVDIEGGNRKRRESWLVVSDSIPPATVATTATVSTTATN